MRKERKTGINSLKFLISNSRFIIHYYFLFFLFCFISFHSFSQSKEIANLRYPWAGGLNSCQFGTIDLNLDGIPDLVIFDRHGNRILPFINEGIKDTIRYTYHPEYVSYFPDLHDWVIFADYDGDGKQDIFTYSLGGTRVFHNVSKTTLKFKLVTNLLTSFYYTGQVGILMTPVDYPGIADIDGDGDLDIVTFFGLGSYVEYHKNLSMETYGNADSLDFRLTDKCWGNFRESEGSNQITLGISCPYKNSDIPGMNCQGEKRHTGSTFLVTDLNGDGIKDVVLGDVDFPDLISMINGGTKDSANMISQDSLFPNHSHPSKIFSFLSAQLIDPDNNGVPDLVISPFDPNLLTAENAKSVWFYHNNGTAGNPDFQFVTDKFFQGEMIDVGSNSYPLLYDVNGDGLTDLLIGNLGYYDSSYYYQGVLHSVYTSKIAYFKNTGTANHPQFTFVTDDLGGLSAYHLQGLYPAMADLNGDGVPDLLLGNSDGSLIYLENRAGLHQEPDFGTPQMNFQNIKAGEFSTPRLFDLNKDGLPDLIIGERAGNLNYYRNTGSAKNPVFTFITDSLGKINVTNYNLSYDGYSTPDLFRDSGGKTRMIVGSDEGILHYYTDIDGNLEGKFTESDSLFSIFSSTPVSIKCGMRTACDVANLTDPNRMDLITGNYSGGLNYFSSQEWPGVYTSVDEHPMITYCSLNIYPNPATDQIRFSASPKPEWQHVIVEIYNSLGQNVLTRNITDPFTNPVDISSLKSGIYLVTLIPGNTSKNGTSLHSLFVKYP
ncbi:MAG: T9SS type A sorting domain-containing protein [Bacteroidota bacterium]|nr:T9SS type A sorting domain-containing protein [Bacteroidota bacterium]